MNAQEHYEQNIGTVQAISSDDIVGLTMPQEQAAAEAEQLLVVVQQDRDLLTARGLNPHFIDTMEARSATFAYAAANFDIHTKGVSAFSKLWNEKGAIGYSLRRKIIAEFEFAFRNNKEAKKNLKEVKYGRGDKDMVLDLLAICLLGNKFPADLEAINFDTALLDQAKALYEEVSEAYAEAMIHDSSVNEARVIRDKAYTWLKEAMDEIRDYGRFVFADNPEKQKHYFSEFYINMGKDSAKKRVDSSTVSDPIFAQ